MPTTDTFVDEFFEIFGQTSAGIPLPDPTPTDTTPTGQAILDIIQAPTTQVTRRVQILNPDGTVYYDSPKINAGSVTVDASRDERRMFDLEIEATTGSDFRLRLGHGSLWYDKVFVLYRGIKTVTGSLEWPLGSFFADQIDDANFPYTIKITGRDHTKKLLLSKLNHALTFKKGQSVADLIRFEAAVAGIFNIILPWNDSELAPPILDTDYSWDADTTRWKIITDICTAFSLEVFFNAYNVMIVRPYRDPATTPSTITFATGPKIGNIATFTRSGNDSQLYNHVVVSGGSTNTIPVWAEAQITDPNSPAHADKIGDRQMDTITSALITTTAQAQTLANSLLKIAALESYSANIGALVIPWLEAGDIATFLDPNPVNANDPVQFFMHDFTIPMTLAPMDVNLNRVELVA